MRYFRGVLTRYTLLLFLALASTVGCKGKSASETDATDATSRKKKPVKRVVRFGHVTVGKRVLTSFPLEGDKPKRWHYRVTLLDDKVQKYALIGPTGEVGRRAKFSYKGGLRIRRFDAYGQQLGSSRLKGQKRTEKHRDGDTTVNGCGALKVKFDEFGRATSEVCMDKDGQNIPDADGCFSVKKKWTNHHQLAEEACFGEGEAPLRDAKDVHRRKYHYNALGQLTRVEFLLETGEPPRPETGCQGSGYEYDDANNEAVTLCLDAAGKPKPFLGSKAVQVVRGYGDNGCQITEEYQQADSTRATRSKVGEMRFKRDKTCALMGEEWRNLKGKLMPRYRGAPARIEYDRDALGLETEQRCFSARGKPSGCYATSGMAQVLRYGYDEKMRLISEAGFSVTDKPMKRMRDYPHLVHYRYDEQGRRVRKDFFDADTNPATGLGSVHAIVIEYDEFGAMVGRRALSVDGLLTRPSTRCAMLKFSRNVLHQLIRIDCLDEDGRGTASRLVYNGVDWRRAASVDIERQGGKLRNVFRSTSGKVVKELDCSKEGVRCLR